MVAEARLVAMFAIEVGALGSTCRGHGDTAPPACFQKRRTGDVIGVHMRFQRVGKIKAEFLDKRAVAPDLLENRIDQDGLATFAARQEIGVSGRLRVEQLPENECHLVPRGGRSGSPKPKRPMYYSG